MSGDWTLAAEADRNGLGSRANCLPRDTRSILAYDEPQTNRQLVHEARPPVREDQGVAMGVLTVGQLHEDRTDPSVGQLVVLPDPLGQLGNQQTRSASQADRGGEITR